MIIPYEIQDIDTLGNWRKKFSWPLNYGDLRKPGIDIAISLQRKIAEIDDELFRDAMILATPGILACMIFKMEAAHFALAMNENDRAANFQTPDLAPLLEGVEVSDKTNIVARRFSHIQEHRYAQFDILRSLKWAAIHSSWLKAPKLVFDSRIEALTLSPILLRYAAEKGVVPIFKLAHVRMLKIRKTKLKQSQRLWRQEIESLVDYFGEQSGVVSPYLERYKKALKYDFNVCLEKATGDLLRLRNSKNIPAIAWSGTGATYAGRAIGLEVLRRGGEMVRFVHGGPQGVMKTFGQIANHELSVSSRFIAASPQQKALIENGGEPAYVKSYRSGEIGFTSGEPVISKFANSLPKRPRRKRPKVVYFLSPFSPFMGKPGTKILNNVLYLDLNYAVCETLQELPIDLVIRPHPEGVRGGDGHPLANDKAPMSIGFSDVVMDADVVICDQPFSTALWQLASTDRGIVFIDTGIAEFSSDILSMIQERFHFVKTTVDRQNRYAINKNELMNAIDQAVEKKVDASGIRKVHGCS